MSNLNRICLIGCFIVVNLISIDIYAQQPSNAYKIIYEADQEGVSINGSLEELLEYVQNGNPVRVGWVLTFMSPTTNEKIEMQHWTDAGFVTTLQGHVFAQVKPIFAQGPSISLPPGVFIANGQPNGWVAIIGTTGVMRQHFKPDEAMLEMFKADGMTDEEIKKMLDDEKIVKSTLCGQLCLINKSFQFI